MKHITTAAAVVLGFCLALCLPMGSLVAHAYSGGLLSVLEDGGNVVGNTISNIPDLTEETTAISKVTSLFITVFSAGLFLGGVGGVVMVIVAGMRLLGSAGDTEEAEGAKSMLIGAVVGVLVIGASLLLVQNLLRFFYWA